MSEDALDAPAAAADALLTPKDGAGGAGGAATTAGIAANAAAPGTGAASGPGTASARAHADWLRRVAEAPYRFDFYQTLRHFEAANPQLPRLGEAARPADEPLRIGQPAELTFAPASLHALQLHANKPPLLTQRIFGLLGPNGPLPTHITELASERSRHHADQGLQRFLDLLSHRLTLLFYRAWAQAQPALSLDRPGDTQFARRLGALAGLGAGPLLQRDAAGDAAKLHFTGRLARNVRDADGLLAWCRSQFDAPVDVQQWCGHWMPLGRDERSRLRARGRAAGAEAAAGQGLGQGAVLGAAVWDVQHKFRIVIGPLPLAGYVAFLPGGADLARLQALVRQWVGIELEWDLRLVLARADVPRLRLGSAVAVADGSAAAADSGAAAHPTARSDRGAAGAPRVSGTPGGAMLGRTTWLGASRQRSADAADLTIDVERTLHARRRRRAAPDAANANAAAAANAASAANAAAAAH